MVDTGMSVQLFQSPCFAAAAGCVGWPRSVCCCLGYADTSAPNVLNAMKRFKQQTTKQLNHMGSAAHMGAGSRERVRWTLGCCYRTGWAVKEPLTPRVLLTRGQPTPLGLRLALLCCCWCCQASSLHPQLAFTTAGAPARVCLLGGSLCLSRVCGQLSRLEGRMCPIKW